MKILIASKIFTESMVANLRQKLKAKIVYLSDLDNIAFEVQGEQYNLVIIDNDLHIGGEGMLIIPTIRQYCPWTTIIVVLKHDLANRLGIKPDRIIGEKTNCNELVNTIKSLQP